MDPPRLLSCCSCGGGSRRPRRSAGSYRTANSDGPPLSTLKQRNPGALTEVFAADGTRLGFIQADDLVQPVAANEFPKVLNQATVAIEDERFYKHKGVDYEGIIRAAVKNATEHKTVQGGSTLTMQLVRNLYTQDDTRAGIEGYKRKIREARLAAGARGGALQGVGARQVPQHRPVRHRRRPVGDRCGRRRARCTSTSRVSELTLREAAMLAGMPQAPSKYSPVYNPNGTKARRNEVLGKMAELGYDLPGDGRRPRWRRASGCTWSATSSSARERYVLDYVKSELIKEYGRETVAARRVPGLHDDQPQVPAGRARGDRRQHSAARAVLGDRHDRPEERRHPGDGLLADLRPHEGQVDVQPRRPGPPPARLLVQDDGADDRAARGREPGLDALRLALADGARRPAVRLAAARGRSRPTAARAPAA